MTNNVECIRCGHRWHAEMFEHGDLPEECPRCYRDAVQPIPEEPSLLDIYLDRLSTAVHQLPERLHALQHRLILWKEDNRSLIEITVFVLAMLFIFSLLYVFIFLWE